MFKRKKEIPVYFFFGFLESGKTSFIKETLKEDQFKDGRKTVYIICEEGIEEVSKKELEENKFTAISIESEDEMEFGTFLEIDKREKPERVVIEYNGTWDPDLVIEALPDNWLIAECITTIDATTYEGYLANMKSMMTRQFTYADLVVFNRSDMDLDLPSFKRTVRALNRRAQVIFEMKDGTINNDIKEELPYDINAKEIKIEDEDYGIWYIDTFDNLDTYVGKVVVFKAVVRRGKNTPRDYFIGGRMGMTCCAEDIQFVGFPCKYEKASELKENTYVNITAKVGKVFNRQFGEDTPMLFAKKVEPAMPAEEEVVYFQ